MKSSEEQTQAQKAEEFSRQAEAPSQSFLGELWAFLREDARWWIGPVVLLLLILGAIVTLGGSAVAPFIYTLF